MNTIKKPTYKDLERQLKEWKAQSPSSLRSALMNIEKTDDRMTASAVIVHITALGGREIVAPFAINDGLSASTIKAIQNDILKTMQLVGIKP